MGTRVIEHGVDTIPLYSFGATKMYKTSRIGRSKRAQFSQKYYLPALYFWGWMGTSIPLTEEVTTVVFDPFPTSKYTIEQLSQCHQDYMRYLKKCFDEYKSQYGMADKELLFIGKDYNDAQDSIGRGLRRTRAFLNHVAGHRASDDHSFERRS